MEQNAVSQSLQPGWFEPTRWSVVLESARTQAPGARDALAELCKAYWRPLYSFARMRGYDHHAAQDVIQSFFLQLIEKRSLANADPLKGRFRSYLLASLQNHMSHEYGRAKALKRGGGMQFVSIDSDDADARSYLAVASTEPSPESAFERQWAVAAVEAALARLEADFTRRKKAAVFSALKPFLTGGASENAYEEAARQLGLSAGALRVGVFRLRAEFRTELRREIARTVSSPDQIDEEMKHLRSVLGSQPR